MQLLCYHDLRLEGFACFSVISLLLVIAISLERFGVSELSFRRVSLNNDKENEDDHVDTDHC